MASSEKSGSDRGVSEVARALKDLANVGPATLGDLKELGITTVAELARQEPFELYERLCELTKTRHDPCVIDVFMATIAEARGGKPMAWWRFTPERKRLIALRQSQRRPV